MRKAQAVVVILLILAVGLTVGLSIVSRSVTEIGVSTTQEESARALAAAEAGIEAALSGVVATGSQPVGTTGSFEVLATAPSGGGAEVAFGEGLVAGAVQTVFLADHDAAGVLQRGTNSYPAATVKLCWGDSQPNPPALEMAVYYRTVTGGYEVYRAGYDSASRGNFSPANSGSTGCPAAKTYAFQADVGLGVPAGADPLFLRLRLLLNGDTPHPVAVAAAAGASFPPQGRTITTLGTSGQTSRRVEVFERYGDPLPLFDQAVFAGGDLVK